MKKIYLIATALVFGSTAIGQQTQFQTEKPAKHFTTKEGKNKATSVDAKAAGVTFYTNNFDTPADWVVNNGTSTSSEFGWSIDAVNDGWWSTAGITSTSGGNFAELSNGDPTASPASQALNVDYTITTANPISLGAYANNVTLSFEQYGARFNDLQEILISTDGVTFNVIGDNLDKTVHSTTTSAPYMNPETKTINLGPLLASTATQIWLQFHWTTNYPTQATNPNVWVAYGWYIDDIKLTSNADNDLQLIESIVGSGGLMYTQMPVSQVQAIDFDAVVTKGANNVTGAEYVVTMNPGAITGTTGTFSITANSLDTVRATVTPPATIGTYTMTSAFTHDSIDDVPLNNVVAPTSIQVTDFIYAHDNGIANGTTDNSGDAFEMGNMFDIVNDVTDCYGLRVRLGTGSPIGELFSVVLYEVTAFGPIGVTEVASSDLFLVEAGMLTAEKLYKFTNPVSLTAGLTYMAVVRSEDGGINIVRAGSRKSAFPESWVYDGPQATWFWLTGTPWVRIDLNPSLGIAENTGSISTSEVFPNPTTGNAELSFTLTNSQDVTVTVVDVSGKTVSTMNLGSKVAGNHSVDINSTSFNSGVYFVNIKSNDGVATMKLIKK